jgi:hypothetical protein
MLYEKVTKRCSAVRLTKDEARESLEAQFPNSEILEIRRRGDKWAATLLMPRTAEFPPSSDGDDESSEEKPEKKDSEGSSEGGESSGPPKADKPPHEEGGPEGPGGPGGGIEHAVAELTSLVHAMAEHMGILPPPGIPGGDDMMGGMGGPEGPPGAGGPPPMGPEGGAGHGGHPSAGGDHQEIIHKTKLKPGEAAPGVTPIGAPAFSSVQASQLQRMASFDAFDDTPQKSIKQAKDELEAIYGPYGFKVRQIKRVENGQRLAAKLTRR